MECFSTPSFPVLVSIALWTGLIWLLISQIRSGNVVALLKNSRIQHLFFGICMFLAVFWHLRIELEFGAVLHFSGLAVVTLIMGARLAILAGFMALLINSLLQTSSWILLPINTFLSVVFPILVIQLIILLERKAASNIFFVYIIFNAFLGAGIAVCLSVITGTGVCWWLSGNSWNPNHTLLMAYLPLIILPEGIINGMLATGLMVYYPEWLRTFDPSRYDRSGK